MITVDAKALAELVKSAVVEALREERAGSSAEFLSTAEAARVASVSQSWIRSQQDAGRLPTHWAGRERRVLRTDLEELLRAAPVEDQSPEQLARQAHGGRR